MTMVKDTNMTRCMMNTMIEWHIAAGVDHRILIVTDATMFDTGAFAGMVNGLHQLTLNIASIATRNFSYNAHDFTFDCKCNGQPISMQVPYEAVLGFIIPTGESTAGFFPVPNMERELAVLEMLRIQRETPPAITPDPFAVRGVDIKTHDSDGNIMPTIEDLMLAQSRSQEPTKPAVALVKPLLDFGPIPSRITPPPSRYKGPPKLTCIIGGKKD